MDEQPEYTDADSHLDSKIIPRNETQPSKGRRSLQDTDSIKGYEREEEERRSSH